MTRVHVTLQTSNYNPRSQHPKPQSWDALDEDSPEGATSDGHPGAAAGKPYT